MLSPKHILLASHDSDGAHAAEKLAFVLCGRDTTLHHLIVVPDLWKGMMGDDWLNNASTRATFGRYVESQLKEEIHSHIQRLMRETAQCRISYEYEVVQGKPTEMLIEHARKEFDLVVLGSHRPRGRIGLRSRMLDKKLFRAIKVPVVIAPYPAL